MFPRIVRFVRSSLVTTGAGMIAVGASDALLDDSPETRYSSSALALAGLATMAAGHYLEREDARFIPQPVENAVHRILSEILGYCKTIGIIGGLTHLAKRAGPTSAATSMLLTGFCFPDMAKQELLSSVSVHYKMPWEKLRFLIIISGDYLTASSMKKVVNGEDLDVLSIVSLPIGFALMLGEMMYTCKNDIWGQLREGVNPQAVLTHTMNRRALKLQIGLGTMLTMQDIITERTDNYSIVSNAYTALVNVFLFASLVEI